MTNFTKGEWEVFKGSKYGVAIAILTDKVEEICFINKYNDHPRVVNANIALIKSSPKMYNLLHKIMLDHCNDSVLYNEIDELLEEARGEY